MAANFLEQLVAEWYEYQGYFIRRNIWVGKRAKGGYECELDIVAFNPQTNHLVHIEPSMDANSWATREARYKKKFEAGRKYIPGLFKGFDIPTDIEQIALLVIASKVNRTTLAGGKIMLASELYSEIFKTLINRPISKNAVPEQMSILRGLQFAAQYRKELSPILFKGLK